MSSVLVSGGTGFIGRFIVEDLLAAGYTVIVGGRSPPSPGLFSARVPFVPFYLDPALDQGATFAGIDHFVHAAFEHVKGRYRGGEGDDPGGFVLANLQGTERLFREAHDAGVKRCVFLSSRAVYGIQQPNAVMLDETTAPRPDTLYGMVKLEAERALRTLASSGFVTASLRITGVYGAAGDRKRHKWQDLFEEYLAGKPIDPRAGTEVHGRDVASAVRLMLQADPCVVSGQVFNVSDQRVDRRNLLHMVGALCASSNPLPDAAELHPGTEMATDRIRALGWKPGGWPLLEQSVRELLRQTGRLSEVQHDDLRRRAKPDRRDGATEPA